MMQFHQYSLTEIEDMLPWERQIYTALLNEHVKEQNEEIKRRNLSRQEYKMSDEQKFHPADTNGDGHVTKEEEAMYLEFKRKELEDADAMRDAQRNMAWFALGGMLLYPFAVVTASLAGLDQAQDTLGDMAPTYFVAVAGIVAAFFGTQAMKGKK